MKLLICGGAGFIGKNFVNYLLNKTQEFRDIKITVIDKLTYAGGFDEQKTLKPSISFIKGDINNYKLIRQIIRDNDFIVNFAAESHVDNSILNPEIFMQSNILGAHTVFNLSNEFNKRVLQVSTDEVYGSVESPAFETDKLNPSSPYASSKASADLIGLSYFNTFGLDVLITRSCNNYGPYQHPEKFIPKTITNLLMGKKVPIYGNGLNEREWIHVSDNSSAIFKVLISGSGGEIYNIGSGVHLSNLQLVLKILRIMNMSDSKIEFVQDRLGHDHSYKLNSDKIRKIGHENLIEFNRGISSCIDWYEQNQDWWRALV